MGNDGAAFSLVLPDQGKILDEIEQASRGISRATRSTGSPPRLVPYTIAPRNARTTVAVRLGAAASPLAMPRPTRRASGDAVIVRPKARAVDVI